MKKITIIVMSLLSIFAISKIVMSYIPDTISKDTGLNQLEFTMPYFTGTTIDNNTYSLDETNDKPVFINFWATWCKYCKDEMLYFDAMEDKYGDQIEFIFISESDGSKKSINKINTYLDDLNVNLDTVIYDTDNEITKKYSIPGYPTTFALDSNNNLISVVPGAFPDEETVEQFILYLLDESNK